MASQINGFFPGEIYPNTTVAGCIDIFENVWPSPKETIDMIEEECSDIDSPMKWSMATTVQQGLNQNHRTNYNLSLTELAKYGNNEVAMALHNQMYFLLLASTVPYAKKHSIEYLSHEGYNVLKYSSGQEYKAHSDGNTEMGRAISAICYLNNDFEGGEVEFPNFNVKIKPEPGMLLLFPSTYPYAHIAHPVTSGTKYAIVTWIRDREV